MGFLSNLFGGGDDKPEAPPIPKFDPRAKEFQNILYPSITSGLRGRGLTPGIKSQRIRDSLANIDKEYYETMFDLPGTLSRIVPKADVNVRQFISNQIKTGRARAKQDVLESGIGEEAEDKDIAQNLAFNALATEKDIASRITNLYNQSMTNRSFAPDFDSALWSGLGGAAGIALGGYQRNPSVSGATPTYGGASIFSPAGDSYLSNQWLNTYNNPAVTFGQGFTSMPDF